MGGDADSGGSSCDGIKIPKAGNIRLELDEEGNDISPQEITSPPTIRNSKSPIVLFALIATRCVKSNPIVIWPQVPPVILDLQIVGSILNLDRAIAWRTWTGHLTHNFFIPNPIALERKGKGLWFPWRRKRKGWVLRRRGSCLNPIMKSMLQRRLVAPGGLPLLRSHLESSALRPLRTGPL